MPVQFYTNTINHTPDGDVNQFRAATGTIFNEYTTLEFLSQDIIPIIDADISALGLEVVYPLMQTCWNVSLQLIGFSPSGKSTFGGTPNRYKLGNISFNFGRFVCDFEQVNYAKFTSKNYQCTYLYGSPILPINLEPPGTDVVNADTLYGLGVWSIKDTAYEEITPLSGLTSATGFGIYFEEATHVRVETNYYAFTVITDQDPTSLVQAYYN